MTKFERNKQNAKTLLIEGCHREDEQKVVDADEGIDQGGHIVHPVDLPIGTGIKRVVFLCFCRTAN